MTNDERLLAKALEIIRFVESNITLIANACNSKHVSEATMDRALAAQLKVIEDCRAFIAEMRGTLPGYSTLRQIDRAGQVLATFGGLTDTTAPDRVEAGADRYSTTCCHTCRGKAIQAGASPLAIHMLLCPTCGNKRCPKASDHTLACTGSNAPGQPGSVY
jgi:hypothetical protein